MPSAFTTTALLALLLAGCDTAEDDTAPPDTDTDTDVDTDGDVDADLIFEIEGGIDSTVLTLNWFSPGPDEPAFDHPPLAALMVTSATQGVSVADPPSTDLVELNPTLWPRFQVAMYLPGLHEDLDADRHHDEIEYWVGVGQVIPTWVAGIIPAEFSKMGLVEGWNAVLPGPSGFGTDATLYPVTGIPLAANLWANLPLTIGGGLEIEGDPSQMGFVALDMDDWSSVAESYPITDPWSITVEERPPEDSVAWDVETGVGTGVVWPFVFTDEDASGGYNWGDHVAGMICDDDELVMLAWAEPTTDLLAARYTDLLVGYTGWAPAVVDWKTDDSVVVDPALWLNLQVSLDCSPW